MQTVLQHLDAMKGCLSYFKMFNKHIINRIIMFDRDTYVFELAYMLMLKAGTFCCSLHKAATDTSVNSH